MILLPPPPPPPPMYDEPPESTKEVTIYYNSISNIIDVSGDNQIIFVQKQNINEILKIKSENTVEFDTILDNTIIMIDALSYSLPQTNLKINKILYVF